MKAMILAAGRGERLKPLTVITPKALMMVGRTTLLAHLLHQLRNVGIQEVVINVHHLREQIIEYCGDGNAFGLRIHYSIEEELLETGGGIFQALPLLGDEPFLVISADIWTDYPLEKLMTRSTAFAHLVLVDNPDFHTTGDFNLDDDNIVRNTVPKQLTYANVGVFHPTLFRGEKAGVFRLSHVLQPAIAKGVVTGERYDGPWFNVGTSKELAALRTSQVCNGF